MSTDMKLTLGSIHVEDDASMPFGLCCFVRKPFHECFCYAIEGKNIPYVIAFCGHDFESCPIYRQKVYNRIPPAAQQGESGVNE